MALQLCVSSSKAQESAGLRRNSFWFDTVLSHLFYVCIFVAQCATSAQVRYQSQPACDGFIIRSLCCSFSFLLRVTFCGTLCHIVEHRGTLCHNVRACGILWNIVPPFGTDWHSVAHCATWYIIPQYAILWHMQQTVRLPGSKHPGSISGSAFLANISKFWREVTPVTWIRYLPRGIFSTTNLFHLCFLSRNPAHSHHPSQVCSYLGRYADVQYLYL